MLGILSDNFVSSERPFSVPTIFYWYDLWLWLNHFLIAWRRCAVNAVLYRPPIFYGRTLSIVSNAKLLMFVQPFELFWCCIFSSSMSITLLKHNSNRSNYASVELVCHFWSEVLFRTYGSLRYRPLPVALSPFLSRITPNYLISLLRKHGLSLGHLPFHILPFIYLFFSSQCSRSPPGVTETCLGIKLLHRSEHYWRLTQSQCIFQENIVCHLLTSLCVADFAYCGLHWSSFDVGMLSNTQPFIRNFTLQNGIDNAFHIFEHGRG